MARGWESKDVESQIEHANAEQRQRAVPQLSADEVRRNREREDLLLSRTRVMADMKTAVHPGYRAMLQRSLDFLDGKLAALNTTDRHE